KPLQLRRLAGERIEFVHFIAGPYMSSRLSCQDCNLEVFLFPSTYCCGCFDVASGVINAELKKDGGDACLVRGYVQRASVWEARQKFYLRSGNIEEASHAVYRTRCEPGAVRRELHVVH